MTSERIAMAVFAVVFIAAGLFLLGCSIALKAEDRNR